MESDLCSGVVDVTCIREGNEAQARLGEGSCLVSSRVTACPIRSLPLHQYHEPSATRSPRSLSVLLAGNYRHCQHGLVQDWCVSSLR